MKLKVIMYDEQEDFFTCKDELNEIRRVDLMTDKLRQVAIEPKSLVGKTVEVHHLIPYIEIGIDVKVVEKEKRNE